MRVLLLTDEMLPGGVARHVGDLANGLHAAGVHTVVAATDGVFRSRLNSEIPFVPLLLLRPRSMRKQFSGLARSVVLLRRLLQTQQFDIVHTHKRYTDIIGSVLSTMFRSRHVSTCHSTFDGGLMYSSFGEVTIAVSNAIRDMLSTTFRKNPERIVMIYNEIRPLKKYSPSQQRKWRLQLGIQRGQKVIVSIGHLLPDKDRGTLLHALSVLKSRGVLRMVRCFIIGEGEESKRLRSFVEERGLDGIVTFLPSDSNVEAMLNIADFCVLSSVRDGGLPYVMLEAASLEKPHIGTRVGGIPEFITHGESGLLVEPQDPFELAEAISTLLKDPATVKRLGRNARKKFESQHCRGEFLKKTLEVYEGILRKSHLN